MRMFRCLPVTALAVVASSAMLVEPAQLLA